MKFSDDQIQQLKDIFATKDDLKGFATKTDLKPFATKDDLKSFATKTDLKPFATKDDFKGFATRDETKSILSKALAPLKRDIKSIKKDLNWVIGKYDTRLNHLEKHIIHPPGRTAD